LLLTILQRHDSITSSTDTNRPMAQHFRSPERRQKLLLPADMMEWLPEDDIVHMIVDAVGMMELSKFEAGYNLGGAGKAPFAPQVLLALLIYAYSQGIRSSRAIERLCGRDAGYRFIVGDAIPDHTVIARFRQRHVAEMQTVFVAVLRLCREAGLVRLGLVALDGTKVAANASLEANRTAASIEEQIKKMLADAETTDNKEDRQFGARRGDALPKSLAQRAERLARLRKCQEKLRRRTDEAAARQQAKIDARAAEEQASGKRKRGRKPKPVDPSIDPVINANVTDPDSGIMKTRRGWLQGYNAQIVVTCGQIILAAEVTTEANDVQQLTPMLAQAQANVAAVVDTADKQEIKLGTVVADAGYWSEANAATETNGCELLIATQKDHKQRAALRDAPPPRGRKPKRMTARERMDRKLCTKGGRERYRHRGAAVEPVFGQMKDRQGARRFSMSGLERCRGEWQLHAAVHNLRKLHRDSVRRAANATKREAKRARWAA
jgi:transposase